jgi:hypothetical protein
VEVVSALPVPPKDYLQSEDGRGILVSKNGTICAGFFF